MRHKGLNIYILCEIQYIDVKLTLNKVTLCSHTKFTEIKIAPNPLSVIDL